MLVLLNIYVAPEPLWVSLPQHHLYITEAVTDHKVKFLFTVLGKKKVNLCR